MSDPVAAIPSEPAETENKTVFGFWVYLMTDCVLFATLFATFAVLRNNTYGGPTGAELFSLPYALLETVILLTSSFTSGLALLAAKQQRKNIAMTLFGVTFLLGLSFLALELTEFRHLAIDGNGWGRSGFLSSFFTLVGTHGLHITSGLIWMLVLLAKIAKQGLGGSTIRRATLLTMFWHFLDVIWIFIFTIVYLMGATI